MTGKSNSISKLFFLFCSAVCLTSCAALSYHQEHERRAEKLPTISANEAALSALNTITVSGEVVTLKNPNHEARFAQDGFTFTPRASDLVWKWELSRIEGVGQGSACAAQRASFPQREGSSAVIYSRGCLIEQYVAHAVAVEQQFLIPEPLDLDGDALVIVGNISSNGEFSQNKGSWVWRSRNHSVRLGDVYVYDRNKKKLNATMSVEAGQTRIEVSAADLEGAEYPVTIDPIVSSGDLIFSNMGVNGNLSSLTSSVDVAYNSTAKEYLIVWSGIDTVAGKYDIFGQRVNAETGAEVGDDDFRISDMGSANNPAYDGLAPSVTYNPTADEYLVVWAGTDDEAGFDPAEYEIFAQRLDGSSGNEIGSDDYRISEVGVTGAATWEVVNPSVVYNSTDNEYLVVFAGDNANTSDMEIMAQRLDGTTGAEIGADDFVISDSNDGISGDFSSPEVIYNQAESEYLVVWWGTDSANNEEEEIYIQRLDAATGAEVGTNDQRISEMGISPDPADGTTGARFPKVALNTASNEYLVVWHGAVDGYLDPYWQIYGQRINAADGSEIGPDDFQISEMGPGDNDLFFAFNPDVYYNTNDNEYVVVWHGTEVAPAADISAFALGSVVGPVELYGQRVSALGVEVGEDDFQISNRDAGGSSVYPQEESSLGYYPDGDSFFVAWTGTPNLAPYAQTEREVMGHIFDPTLIDLSVSIDDGNDPKVSGSNFTLTVDTSNTAVIAAQNVTVTLVLDDDVSYVSASGSGWVCSENSGTVTCTAASLSAKATSAIALVVSASQLFDGTVTTSVSISAASPSEPNLADNSDTETTTLQRDTDGDTDPDLTDPDDDGDTILDGPDNCPLIVNVDQADADGDGVGDACDDTTDACPADPSKTAPGVCGCGIADADSDGDGLLDCEDECPANINKQTAGDCGCVWDREEEDLDEDGTPDCELPEDKLFSVSGRLFIDDELGQRIPFFETADTRSSTNSAINDIWVEGYRHAASGKKLDVGRVKISRTGSGGAMSYYIFSNLPGVSRDSNGNPIFRIISTDLNGETVSVPQIVGGYTFVIRSYNNNLSVSRDFKMQDVANREVAGVKLAGCATEDVGTYEWITHADGRIERKEPRCLFDPLYVDQDLVNMDHLVNGCTHDTLASGQIVVERHMSGRQCWTRRNVRNGRSVEYYRPAKVKDLTATAGTRSDGVRLQWSAAARAASYRILRSQYPEENTAYRVAYAAWQHNIGAEPVFKGDIVKARYFPAHPIGETITYLDTSAVPGVEYDYLVIAENGASSSPHGMPATGWRSGAIAEDADGDGVSDEQEVADTTDRFDPGSYVTSLSSPVFTKYNTFLNQLNWLELIAVGSEPVHVALTIFDSSGSIVVDNYQLTIPAGEQIDTNIGELVGNSNSYGQVKIAFNDHSQGVELLGRMAVYRQEGEGSSQHSFAFVRELANPSRGAVFAGANTIDPEGQGNLVPNWLEILNVDSVARKFSVRIYDTAGSLVYDSDRSYESDGTKKAAITIPAYGELDLQAGHEFGEGVYLVEVAPSDGATNFYATVVRYSSQTSPTGQSTYAFAMPIPAARGSGSAVFAPIRNEAGSCWLQSNWIELVNTRTVTVPVEILFRNSLGEEVARQVVSLKPFAQEHYNAGALLATGDIGQVQIVGAARGSIKARSNIYYHDCEFNFIQTAYSTAAQLPSSRIVVGSFNSYLSMQNILSVANTMESAVSINVVSARSDQGVVDDAIAPYATRQFNLVDQSILENRSGNYGRVVLSPRTGGMIVSENLRVREVDGRMDFVIPTRLH